MGDPRHPDLVADWMETRTRMTLSGPEVTGVRAGRVRLRGRLIDGRISLGTLDKLMGGAGSSGTPFQLPKLDVIVQDGGIRRYAARGHRAQRVGAGRVERRLYRAAGGGGPGW